MAFDTAGAYKAGYSDAEIADFLAQKVGYDNNAARQAGYSDRELVDFLRTNQPEGGFGAAFSSNVEGVKSAGIALLGRTGLMDTKAAEEYMAEKEVEQRKIFRPTEKGWLEDPLTKTLETVGQSLPFMVAPIVGAGIGVAAAGTAPAWLAAGLGSTALSALQFTGTNLQRQVNEDVPLKETDLLAAGAAAIPQALLDTVALRFIPGVRALFGARVGKEITEEQAKKIAERMIVTNLAAAGAKTASVEAATEVGQQALERFQAGLNVLDKAGQDELIESAIGGGVLGFLFGVPGGVNVRGRAEKRLAEAENKRLGEMEDASQKEQTQTAPPRAGTEQVPQGELFPAELDAAQVEADQIAGPKAPEIIPEAVPEAIPETLDDGQLPLGLVGGRTPEQQEIEGIVGAKNEQEIAAVKAAREEQTNIDRLKFESDLAQIDAEVQGKQQKTAEDQRLQLLLPIIANPDVKSIPSQFGEALKAAGIKDTEFTERERNLITRAQDFKAAEPLAPVASELVPSTPNDPVLEEQIKQGDLFSREPEQLGLPGVMGKGAAKRAGKTRAVTEPETVGVQGELGPIPIIDEQALDTLKLPKAAAVRKRLLGKDMNDPAQRQQVNTELRAVLQNPNTPKETKEAVREVLAQSEFTRQNEMFGPRGGVLPDAAQSGRPITAPTATAPTATAPTATAPTATAPTATAPITAPTATAPEATTAPTATAPITAPITAPTATAPEATTAPTQDTVEVNPTVQNDPFATAVVQLEKATIGGKNSGIINPAAEPVAPNKIAKKEGLGWGAPASKLVNVDALPLQNQLDPSIVTALKNNDLVGALDTLASRTKGVTSKFARVLATRLKNSGVKVQVVTDTEIKRIIFDRTGSNESDIKGVFFASDSTVYINSDIGLDAHTLIHEATHPLVDAVLNNNAHPLTKQLQKLFTDVKEDIGTAYGTTDLKEFVAEFMGNPEFRDTLDSIYPDGGKVSALRKMSNSIGNFVRRLLGMETKGVDSALGAADNIIASILAPGQTALLPPNTMREYSFLRQGATPFDAVADMVKNLPGLTEERIDKIDEFFKGKAFGAAKNLLRAALPLEALVKVADKYLPSADLVRKLVNEKHGTENLRMQSLEPIQNQARDFAKGKTLAQMGMFNDVIYASTIAKVDPSKPRDTYEKDKEKLQAWDDLQKNWADIGPDGQALYTSMRDSYRVMYNDILRVIEKRLDSVTADPATNAKVKKDILSRLTLQAGKIEPYFPLTRKGDYWLTYALNDPKGGPQEKFIEAFESERARARATRELENDPSVVKGTLENFSNVKNINYSNAPSGSFMNSVFNVLTANNVDKEVTEEMMTLFINSLPATSFAQSFKRRKNRLGFQRDALAAFREKSFSISRQLSNLEYSAKLNDVQAKLAEEMNVSVRKGNPDARKYYEELEKRIKFANNPNVAKWSQYATGFGFAMTLGFNLSAAIVNLSQIPLMVVPYYGGKYGYPETMRAIGNAIKVFTTSGRTQERRAITGEKRTMSVGPSIDNYNFDAMRQDDPLFKYKYLAEEAGQGGQLARSQIYDTLDVDNLENPMAKVNAVSGFIFHHGERMNRQIAMIAAYDLELGKMQKEGKAITPDSMREAANTAIGLAELTNGGIAAAAAPRIAQNSLGRVMFMYKRYGVSMYYAMFTMARDALKSQNPEVRKMGMRQVAGTLLSAGMMAGVQGLPLYGVGALVYNLFKEDDDDNADTIVRKYLGETLYKGLPNAVLGVDVAARIGLSDLLFRENPVQRDQEPMAEIMEFIGGPVYSVGNRTLRGIEDIRQGNTQRGIEQMLPSAFSNVSKALRFATEGANSRRGDPIIEDVGYGSIAAQMFGFSPAKYTRQLEINSIEKGKERAVNEKRTSLLRKFNLAINEGDSDTVNDLLGEMQEFSQRHPANAITADTVRRSRAQFNRTSAEMRGGVRYSKKYMSEFEQSMREYDEE